MKVIFLHPDLGIGGAERLVIDAALSLQNRGHEVQFYTNHYDPVHSFQETRDGSLQVHQVGSWLPRSILGRCRALCAYMRFVYAALYLVFCVIPTELPDVIFCDLISLCIPFLKLSPNPVDVIFYCHYPDKLLTTRRGIFKRLYRAPLDWLEEKSTARADIILVNSEFTAKVFKESFPTIKISPDICYPSINTIFFDKATPKSLVDVIDVPPDTVTLLSINRYERKKNLALALKSLHTLKSILTIDEWDKLHLVMAGGYDPINSENKEHYEELCNLASELQLMDRVTFLKSPSDIDKISLLCHSDIVVYTPSNEHFGIVPLEAMYYAKPVVAVNSGGPTETIVQNITGFLSEPSEADFANSLKKIIINSDLRSKMGEAGRQRFIARFSYDAFTEQLDNIVRKTYKRK